jgi:hypothetical protein
LASLLSSFPWNWMITSFCLTIISYWFLQTPANELICPLYFLACAFALSRFSLYMFLYTYWAYKLEIASWWEIMLP